MQTIGNQIFKLCEQIKKSEKTLLNFNDNDLIDRKEAYNYELNRLIWMKKVMIEKIIKNMMEDQSFVEKRKFKW